MKKYLINKFQIISFGGPDTRSKDTFRQIAEHFPPLFLYGLQRFHVDRRVVERALFRGPTLSRALPSPDRKATPCRRGGSG